MSGNIENGRVSIILTNFNALPWLGPCFDSLQRLTYKNVEIIFVDNHSSDDSVEFVRSRYPQVHLIINERDEGFAQGNNIGVQHSHGEYILLLNTDTTVPETFMEDMLRAFRDIPHLGVAQPKLFWLHDPRKLDSCGSLFSATGFLKHVGNQQREELPEFNTPFPVFAVKGACMMFRRDLLEKTGGLFDPDYYCYFEETDFCMRVWLAGYECWYYPKASIHHAMGGVTGKHIATPVVQYHSFKNRLMTYLKNFSRGTLFRVLPLYALLNILVSLSFLVTGKPGNFLAVYRAAFYNLKCLRVILEKRDRVQRQIRMIPDKAFLARVTGAIGLHQLFRTAVYLCSYERGKFAPGEIRASEAKKTTQGS